MRMTVPRICAWALAATACVLAFATVPARGDQAVALMSPNTLAVFDTATPTTVAFHAITGLGANEAVRGIDIRPADGQLYGVTVASASAINSIVRTYRLDPATGGATLIGATAAALAGAGDVPTGIDFNPVVDRVRYVNTNDESARTNPDNGALAGNDTDLNLAGTSDVVAVAYDRNKVGGTVTTLFAINRIGSQLARQGGVDGTPSPNAGTITNIGPLGLTIGGAADGGFDITAAGTAFAALTNAADNLTRLYTINLITGAATAVSLIGSGTSEVRSLALIPPPPPPLPPPLPLDTDSDGVPDATDICPKDVGPALTKGCVTFQRGTAKRDVLKGTPLVDRLLGLAGNDDLVGYAADDNLDGGDGSDRLLGGRGNDRLVGGRGDDALEGGIGRDSYAAGRGNDVVRSRDGVREVVDCGTGVDTLIADRLDVAIRCERVLRR